MKLRNSHPNLTTSSRGGDLEFEALKDTVWRLTCRVVSLESEIAELKERFELSPGVQRQGRNRRNCQNQTMDHSVSGIDPGDLLAVELSQEQEQDPNNPDGEILQSFSDASDPDQDLEGISNDSNYTPKTKIEDIKIWSPVKRQRKPPRIGPDGERVKNHECHICQRKFTRNEHLQDHIRSHQGNTFSCMTCGGTFAYKNALRRHEKYRCKIKLTLEQLTCKTCNKVFRGKKNLGIHMRVHSEKRGLKTKQSPDSASASAAVTSGYVVDSIEPLGMPTFITTDSNDDGQELEDEQDHKMHMHQIMHAETIPIITSVSSPHMDFTDMIQL